MRGRFFLGGGREVEGVWGGGRGGEGGSGRRVWGGREGAEGEGEWGGRGVGVGVGGWLKTAEILLAESCYEQVSFASGFKQRKGRRISEIG